jgi:hypothetical protein
MPSALHALHAPPLLQSLVYKVAAQLIVISAVILWPLW